MTEAHEQESSAQLLAAQARALVTLTMLASELSVSFWINRPPRSSERVLTSWPVSAFVSVVELGLARDRST